MDIQVAIHTDTLNESGFLEDTMKAIDGRVIHTFHTEGAGGVMRLTLLKRLCIQTYYQLQPTRLVRLQKIPLMNIGYVDGLPSLR